MATDHSGGDGKENRNITMHISVFCGSSLPRNKEIVEAAAPQQNHAEKLMYNNIKYKVYEKSNFDPRRAVRHRADGRMQERHRG
jgi:hypothetical protein